MTTTYNRPRYIIAIILIALSSLSYAGTIQVTNTNDAGAESLRQAVMDAAASGDTIRFSSGIDGDTIKLITEITLDKDLVILGNDSTNTIIDGMMTSRIFRTTSGHTIALDGVRLQNGNGEGVNFGGGAIYNEGILTLTNSSISDNVTVSSSAGGGIYIAFTGTMTLTNSTISGNTSSTQGGGIRNLGTVILTNCVISGNTASSQGGGILNSFNGTVALTNSTISGNTASSKQGGGIFNASSGTVALTNSTISGNTATTLGGGIFNTSSGTVVLTNSIISGNTANSELDISNEAKLSDGGYNLIGDGSGQSTIIDGTNGNQVGTTAIPIDPLFISDVPTAPSTGGDLRLQCGSPAIDAGTPDTTGLNVGAVDLLGNPRITGTIDIGAHEQSRIVMNTNDAGTGSLRDIVVNACPGDTITFDASLNGDTINLVTEISLDKNLVIIGNPAASAGQAPMTIIDGMDNSRIFYIPTGRNVDIHNITLQHGNGQGTILPNKGGAILNEGELSLINMSIIESMADDEGGAIYSGGDGTATIINSRIAGNSAINGGGLFNYQDGIMTLINTIVSGNQASGNGGALYNDAGDAIATITNSTISGNVASSGGGVITFVSGSSTTFTNTIVTKNVATSGVANAGHDISAALGGVMDGGHNLIGDGSGQTAILNGMNNNQVGTTAVPIDPLFVMDVQAAPSTVGDLRLRCGSPAIDAGDDIANTSTEDINGLPRKVGTIDIGSHERPADMGSKIVTTLADDGPGSLRDMVLIACPEDTIRFHASLDMDTIKLLTEIILNKNLVIVGNDTTNTIIDGMDNSRIFHITSGDTVSISGIRMQGGNGIGAAFSGFGGAILNQGVATLNHSAVSGNTITTTSKNGGGIVNLGTLMLVNTTVSDNTTTRSGGGISSSGIVTLTNSTVSGNTAAVDGGGIFNVVPGTVTMTNSILSGNMATNNGGGLYNPSGTVANLTNATISGNEANVGGGVFNELGNTTFTNTIVALNTASTGPDIADLLGNITDGGHNLIGDGIGQVIIINGMNNNQVGPDSLFIMDVPAAPSTGGDLRLACGSPAIDAGSNATATTAMVPDTDINGNPRIITKTIDIGAYEFQASDAPSPVTLVTNTNDSGCGSLRFAVCNAMAGDTIRFDASLDMDTIKLVTEITIDTNVIITGNGATKTFVDGMGNSRIFYIPAGDTVVMDGVTLLHGSGVGTAPSGNGGAVLNRGMLTLANSNLLGNTAVEGGGVYNRGALTLFNSRISGNKVDDSGGGIFIDAGISELINCTISGNMAANEAGGIFIDSDMALTNSIVAKNIAPVSTDILIDASFIDGGHNLIGDTATASLFFDISTLLGNDATPIDPLFVMDVPVAPSTGGDLRLKCGSPAIDSGKPDTTGLNLGLVDLGGNPRIITKTIDIGAYELQASDVTSPITLVTNTNDSGCGSLRFAVCNAMAGDTIRFHASLDMDTIMLVTEITIDTNLVIIGNPVASTGQAPNIIIDGMGDSRIFYIPTGDTVVMDGVALRNGSGLGTTLDGYGGAVLNQGNTTITNSTITESMAASGGGGIYNNNGAMTLTNNTISENIAPFGGGIFNDGAMVFTNNTISANTASMFSGGGVSNSGTMILTNGSISGNDAPSGGGVSNDLSLTLINATISGNTATTKGGGVINDGGSLTLMNSIIALNSAVTAPDIHNEDILNDGGNNLIGDGSGQSDIEDGVNGNQVGTAINPIDPLFVMDVPTNDLLGGDLRLKSCSPARDAGNDAANTTTEDILGNPRIIDVIDIGAYERALGTDSKLVNTLVDAGAGSLRFMIGDACPSDTIRFDSNLDTDTIKLTSGEIILDKNLLIIGNEIANTIIDGQASSPIFQISQGDTVSIKGLTIQNGKSMSDGGGILNQGVLTLNEVALMSNVADARGGGIYNNQFGSATITNSTVSQNSADKGGGIYNKDSDVTFSFGTISDNMATTQGGGVFSEDEATFSLISSSLFINSADEGAGMYNTFKSTTTVSNSSIDSNTATGNGGGFYNDVTAIANFDMSSFADNKAADGGALFNNGGTTTFMNMNIAGTGDGADMSGVLSITGETEFKTTTVFARNE